jgi:hypothetical protein
MLQIDFSLIVERNPRLDASPLCGDPLYPDNAPPLNPRSGRSCDCPASSGQRWCSISQLISQSGSAYATLSRAAHDVDRHCPRPDEPESLAVSEPLVGVPHDRGAVVSHGLGIRRKSSDLTAQRSALSTMRRTVRMTAPSYRSVTRTSHRKGRASLSRHVSAMMERSGRR